MIRIALKPSERIIYMTGRRYYLTTAAAWRPLAHRCTEAHFIALDNPSGKGTTPEAQSTDDAVSPLATDAALILVLVTADEAAHIALETNPQFEPLPHPLARTPVSERVASALAYLGVLPGDDTFTVAEKLGRVNPLLRHRVF
jgi:hypothetical protein